MIRITIVIGSYKKGNTYNVVQLIEQKIKEQDNVQFEYIFLKDQNFEQCKGCFICLSKGEKMCPLKDNLLDIEKRLMDSDGVIFASPNYACGVTSLMKRFIERFAYIGHRPRFFNRFAVVVATSAGPIGLKETLKDLSYFAGGGFTIVYSLGLITPPFQLGKKEELKKNRQIEKCVKILLNAIKSKKTFGPTWGSIAQYSSFRAIYRSNSVHGEQYFPADMEYWRQKGWLDKKTKFFVDLKINPLKRAFGLLLETIIALYTSKTFNNIKK